MERESQKIDVERESRIERPPVCESTTCYTFTPDMGSFTSLL